MILIELDILASNFECLDSSPRDVEWPLALPSSVKRKELLDKLQVSSKALAQSLQNEATS